MRADRQTDRHTQHNTWHSSSVLNQTHFTFVLSWQKPIWPMLIFIISLLTKNHLHCCKKVAVINIWSYNNAIWQEFAYKSNHKQWQANRDEPCEQTSRELPGRWGSLCQRVVCMSDHKLTDTYNTQHAAITDSSRWSEGGEARSAEVRAVRQFVNVSCVQRWTDNMIAQQIICYACVNFFLLLYDFLQPNYLRIYWTDFHIFFTKW